MKKYILYFFIVATIAACKDISPLCEDTEFTYVNEVKPIIDANCSTTGCHSQGASIGDYTTYEGLEETFGTKFKNRVITKGDMPKGTVLNFGDKATLQCWIEHGFQEK